MKLTIVQPGLGVASETFLRAHAELLPFDTTVVHFDGSLPCVNHNPILSQSLPNRAYRKLKRELAGRAWDWEVTEALVKAFKAHAEVVLAEFGPIGVRCCEAARLADVPLVVHFHGFDASIYNVIEQHKEGYKKLFQQSSVIIAVSNKMVYDLKKIGAPPEKIHLNPCGVDVKTFSGVEPDKNPPVLVSVGRFVEKKAPYLTIMAFAKALEKVPDAKMVMLGGGALLGVSKDIASALGIIDAIEFRGECTHDQVREAMLEARGFVQHSIKASDGDCEGTPVGVMEASSIGLPVIATAHAGIADLVEHEKSGYLVEEKNVAGMAEKMINVLSDPALAKSMGNCGRERVKKYYSMQGSIDRLGAILTEALR